MNERFLAAVLAVTLISSPSFADSPDLTTLQAWAAKGDAEAQLNLGRDYQLGRGVPIDYAKAFGYYQQAAAQGNAKAMFNLGYLYRHGLGIAPNNDKANEWFQKAADRGLAAGQLAMGYAYYYGDSGLTKDYATAFKWLTLAAQQTNSPAQSAPAADILGTMYEYGTATPKDSKQAVFWYRQSAEMGNAKGQSNLGEAYYEGLMVKRDLVEAYKWLKLGAAQGEQLAIHALSEDLVAKAFTPEQIAEGDRQVNAYQAERHKPPITNVPFVVEPESMPPKTPDSTVPTSPAGATNSMLSAIPPGMTNSPVAVTRESAPAGH